MTWFANDSYQCMESHCGNKTILRRSHLHSGISYTGDMTSSYSIRAVAFKAALRTPSIKASYPPRGCDPSASGNRCRYRVLTSYEYTVGCTGHVRLFNIAWYIVSTTLPSLSYSVIRLWWRHQMETFPRYWPFVGKSPVTDEFRKQWPLTRSFDVFLE